MQRTNAPMDVALNLTALLSGGSVVGEVDTQSARLVEHDGAGGSATEVAAHYRHELVTGAGLLFFNLSGVTAAGAQRWYHFYFDVVANGPKAAPLYWSAVPSSAVDTGALQLSNIHGLSGSNYQIDHITRLGNQQDWLGLRSRLQSSAGAYGTNNGTAANPYGSTSQPLLLLGAGGVFLLEYSGAAGSLALKEYFLFTGHSYGLVRVQVGNPSAVQATGVSYVLDYDYDIGGFEGDTAGYLVGLDAAYALDTSLLGVFAVTGPQSVSHSVGEYAVVDAEVQSGTLSNTDTASGDVGMALQFALPDLQPFSTESLRYVYGIGTTAQDLGPYKASWLTDPPQVTVGNLNPQP